MISAIVLAAGAATRFGASKQLAPIGGKPLLEHVLGALRASVIDDVVVVLGAHADAIRRHVGFTSERVVLNSDYALGMSTSIQAGLRALPADVEAAMIVLGDQPYVRARTLDALVGEYRRTRAAAVIPAYRGTRGNPVIVDRALFAELLALRGDVGGRSIFATHHVTVLDVDDPGVIADIDTAGDLDGA
jgi:molybdenum cofactor cytidylyltransferase